ncbi:hypothetical protein fugu_003833 [Takifugu bimaculatus]|uniref:Uncharacterized protein n=1 Tax=Takifugu bimaculatus TaxID=433685 RepID=A0A4Z2BCE9_9TELE|nr:hypothetical protein fugu_003833 [Takifugu bimaculatus]
MKEQQVMKTDYLDMADHRVLEKTSGIEEPGGLRWELFGCLLLGWVIIFLCLVKGIKSTGKLSPRCPSLGCGAPLFFIMLLCLGLDSQFANVEVVITCIKDELGSKVSGLLKREALLSLIVCTVGFILGIPHVTKGGIYVFQLMDTYTAVLSVVFLAFCEVVAVCWIFVGHLYSVQGGRSNPHNINIDTKNEDLVQPEAFPMSLPTGLQTLSDVSAEMRQTVGLLVVRAAVTCAVALQLGWPEGVQTRSGNLIFIPQSLLTVAALMHHGRVYWSQDASL